MSPYPDLMRQLASLVLIGLGFSILHDVASPVVSIHMALGIGIPFEFSTDRGGIPAQGLGNVFLYSTFPSGLPNVKPFFVADMLIRGHRGRSFRSDGWCRRIIASN